MLAEREMRTAGAACGLARRNVIKINKIIIFRNFKIIFKNEMGETNNFWESDE